MQDTKKIKRKKKNKVNKIFFIKPPIKKINLLKNLCDLHEKLIKNKHVSVDFSTLHAKEEKQKKKFKQNFLSHTTKL